MDFQELGQTLKQERERKGLSIEVVMESTKISRTNIVAIENGDRSTLPHPVYAKGFIKSYARFLGLDADELCMVVDREYQDEADGPEEHVYEVSPAAERAFQEAESPEKKGKSSWPLVLVVLLLLVAGVLIFMNLNSDDSDKSTSEVTTEQTEKATDSTPPVPEVPEVPVEQPEASAPEEGAIEAAPDETDIVGSGEASQGPAQAETPSVSAPPVEAKPEVQPEQPVEKPAEPVAQNEPEKQKYDHVLVIRATTEKGCWIGVWKGDEANMSRDFVLQQGEPLRLMFNSPRRIRIGNVAGVTVTYNGKPYQLDATTSNIQTLKLGF